jgi:hypothetical protein
VPRPADAIVAHLEPGGQGELDRRVGERRAQLTPSEAGAAPWLSLMVRGLPGMAAIDW